MTNALILHGKPTRERYENPNEPKPHEANWLPWLAGELARRGIRTAIPAFPEPYFPRFDQWKEVFEEHEVNKDTVVVGHSAGSEFALRWLSENSEAHVNRLLLIAPYQDVGRKYGDFSDYRLDEDLHRRVGRITIFNSSDDDIAIRNRAQALRTVFPSAHYVEFADMGHFRLGHNMDTIEFPQALEELLTED